jgi:hypothetical protein
LTPSPIRKVLFTFRRHRVRALLMGGQACILYGGAEFSRDTDFVVLCEGHNLKRLQSALDELRAEAVFVPPLRAEHLLRGHACQFRCRAAGVSGSRVDVMSVMRNCDPFPALWRRRKRLRLPGIGSINVLSLPDLVAAKKTQRDKDWPMIRRLLEADYVTAHHRATAARIAFWLQEMRSPELLVELAGRYPRRAAIACRNRPLLRHAIASTFGKLQAALDREEAKERATDRAYWMPLRRELNTWRHLVVATKRAFRTEES